MSVRVTLSCDYSDKDLAWCANEDFTEFGTVEEVRKMARKNGWVVRKGKDYHSFHFKKRKA